MNRKQLFFMALVALVSGIIGGMISNRFAIADAPKIITAHQLRIIDAHGNVRATFGVNEKGASVDAEAFRLIDKERRVRGGLGVSSDNTASLILFDKDLDESIKMLVAENANTIVMGNKSFQYRIVLMAAPEGPSMSLIGKNGGCAFTGSKITVNDFTNKKTVTIP